MKKIGLVGGISWTSTLDYYRYINEGINKEVGGLHSAECIIYSLNFNDIQEAGWDKSFSLIFNACRKLEDAGVDLIVLGANTAHLFADYIQKGLNIPIIHIADATGKVVIKQGLKKVGLLGTSYTMEMDFYHNRLKYLGIESIIPGHPKSRSLIQRIVKEELGVGKINSNSKKLLIEEANQLIDRGAQGIVLACTELPLIISQDDFEVRVFDTTRIHAEAIIEKVL